MITLSCDLCGGPIKDKEAIILHVDASFQAVPNMNDFKELSEYWEAYHQYILQWQKKGNIICPGCKAIIDALFANRKLGIENLEKKIRDLISPDKFDEK